MTYADLIALDPRFACLDTYARNLAFRAKKRWRTCCGNRLLEEGIKPEITAIVNSTSSQATEALSSPRVHLCALDHLRALMPKCRGCNCGQLAAHQ